MAVYLSTGDRVKTTHELIEFWVERATTKRAPDERGEHETKSSILCEGDRLYHYGHHFELARVLRTKGGRPKLIVLNGDTYSGSGGWGNATGSRQGEVRNLVSKRDVPYVVLPFSALSAAGISAETVVPLEVREDRWEQITRQSNERPGPLLKMDDPSGATYTHTEEKYGYVHRETGEVSDTPSPDHQWSMYAHETTRPVQVDDPNRAQPPSEAHGWADSDAVRGDDGVWRWDIRRHWLGDSLFKGHVTEERMRLATPAEVQAYEEREKWSNRWRELRDAEDRARTANSNLWFIDRKYEREESLTLGENPPPRPTPEEMAHGNNDVIDAMAAVRAHEANQPDGVHNADRHRGTKRIWVRHTVRRWAKFLSSFDYNEPHSPYFLCELRHGCPATTVDEAVEDLKPQVVKDALAAGVDVLRQGDVFLIPTAYTTDELKSRAVTFKAQRTVEQERWDYDEERGSVHVPAVRVEYDEPIRKLRGQGESDVLGTNHSPTHAILTKDGEWFGRGRMYHTPRQSWRNPEHRTLDLGDRKTWYRCIKNTVPLDKASGSSRGNVIHQVGGGRVFTGQSRAWMLGGAVD